MNAKEARELVDLINTQVQGTRDMLLRLRDEEGWKALGYESWRECATKEFKLGTSRVYQLVTAAEVQKALPKSAPPINERVARELGKLPEPDRAPAYQAAVDRSGGKAPSAKKVREAVKERRKPDLEPPVTKVPKGDVPDAIRQAIEKGRADIGGVVADLRHNMKELEAICEEPIGGWINWNHCKSALKSTIDHLELSTPHAPCPHSHANGFKGCKACKGSGWIPKLVWKNTDPSLRKGHE